MQAPMLIGETGVPFDLGVPLQLPLQLPSLGALGAALLGSAHPPSAPRAEDAAPLMALERTMGVLEANLASFTLWNYTPEHTRLHGERRPERAVPSDPCRAPCRARNVEQAPTRIGASTLLPLPPPPHLGRRWLERTAPHRAALTST